VAGDHNIISPQESDVAVVCVSSVERGHPLHRLSHTPSYHTQLVKGVELERAACDWSFSWGRVEAEEDLNVKSVWASSGTAWER
jgi:hypothetical protein